ncbi:hypothetical protein B566_EDAN003485 [Ephemera danica]|nr:hypothetical protein B566_EDAN003485 [Ephemera danica]
MSSEPVEVSEALRNLSSLGKPFEISFEDMMGLMEQCQELHMPVLENVTSPNKLRARSAQQQPPPARSSLRGRLQQQQRGLLSNTVGNPFSIFNGIVPVTLSILNKGGTKWCGTGDIASTYYDLGSEQALDRCCRTHDLCPVKVRPFQTRFNLTNAAIFSKAFFFLIKESHCECDDALFRCLKNARSATADVLGNIYFNIVQVPCLEHVLPPAPPTGVQGVEPMRFTAQHFSY